MFKAAVNLLFPCIALTHALHRPEAHRASRFMSPQRQGNENLPESSVQPPVGQELGLTYSPWQGTDDDDLDFPSVNVHFDYEPKDWVHKIAQLNEEEALRREAGKTAVNMEKIQELLNGQISDVQDMKEVLSSQLMQARGKATGQQSLLRHIPDALKTGSGLDTPEASETQAALIEAAPVIKETKDAYQGAFLTAFSPGADFYLHMADEYARLRTSPTATESQRHTKAEGRTL